MLQGITQPVIHWVRQKLCSWTSYFKEKQLNVNYLPSDIPSVGNRTTYGITISLPQYF